MSLLKRMVNRCQARRAIEFSAAYHRWMHADINDSYDENGVFWTIDDPEVRIPGRLYRQDNKIRLQLHGTPRTFLKTVEASSNEHWVAQEILSTDEYGQPITIHGDVGRFGKITAQDCQFLNSTQPLIGTGPEHCLLAPRRLLHGSHVSTASADLIGIRFRLRNLDKWAVQRGVDLPANTISGVVIKYTRPEYPVFSNLSDGAVVTIEDVITESWSSITDAHIAKRAWVEISSISSGSLDEIILRYVAPIISLVELSLGVECDPVDMSAQLNSGSWVRVSSGSIRTLRNSEDYSNQLVNFDDIGISGVATWLDKAHLLGPFPSIVSRLGAENRINLETHLLELTTVAEGIHDCLHPDGRSIPKEEAEEIKEIVKSTLLDTGSNYVDIVTGSLRHLGVLGYAKRMISLVEHLGPEPPAYVGDVKKWAREVEDARVGFAHRRIRSLTDDQIERLFIILSSLQWLLASVLLMEAGIQAEVVNRRISKLPNYRTLLTDARSAYPKIYAT